MGLIREVQSINSTIDRKAREKQERENKKILIEQYKKEIDTNLQAIFYKLFTQYGYTTAYKKAILQKDLYIGNITKIIESIKELDRNDGKTYYKYKNQFDIVQDIQDNYNKILNKTATDFKYIDKLEQEETEKKLYNEFIHQFEISSDLALTEKNLKRQQGKNYIIQETAGNKKESETMDQIYYKTLQKAIKPYKVEIEEQKELEKEKIKALKQQAVIDRADRMTSKWLFTTILHDINKHL